MVEVSIIVPVYNAQKTLDKCLGSILNQSFNNFEIILINDGSTDNSKVICDKYAEADHRIKVIHKKNQGVSHTRNIGLDNTTGKYIQFVDSDDWLEEKTLERLIDFMDGNTDIVMCGYKRVLMEGNTYKLEKDIYTKDTIDVKVRDFLRDYYYYFEMGLMYALWNKLFKREIIQNNNIRFNENLSLGEDLLFNIEYMLNCEKITNTCETLYNYVIFDNDKSLSTRFNPKRLEAQVMMYTNIIDMLNKFGQFKDENEEYFRKGFSKAIIGSVKNYLNKGPDTREEKRRYLESIYQNQNIMKNISLFGNGSLVKNIIAFLMLIKSKNILISINDFNLFKN
jgi:glycosyltransferase involved in cell wall biosynthesis